MAPAPTTNVHRIDHQRLPGGGDPANLTYTVEPRDARMTVVRAANVRSGPATEFDKVSELEPGSKVSVTGVTSIAGHKWFAVVLDDGSEGFVWAPLLRGDTVAARPAPATPVVSDRAGNTIRDCPACPDLVVIPPGEFLMGSTDEEITYLVDEESAEIEWISDETPRHKVRITYRFAVGKYEVTRAQYAAFIRGTDHRSGTRCHIYKRGDWRIESSRNWRTPGYSRGENEPVVCVNWRDAKAYVVWLSETTGHAYRLLSEAEWEYVTRAGTTTRRYWGDDPAYTEACRHGNVSDLIRARSHRLRQTTDNIFMCEDGIVRRAPVRSYLLNPFGLHDMLGNVWEWTEDCYQDTYQGAPGDGGARSRENCIGRVLRGGSWDFDPRIVRSANRGWAAPHDRSGNVGFRVARDLP